MEQLRAEPSASSLIESMRDIGYTLETALADIIDNSVTAESTLVEIHLETHLESPTIAVIDNGKGMLRAGLIAAMKPGSRNPLEARKVDDLGRFGLGLKTASFSQCRRLTVVTKRNGEIHAALWDLDEVAKLDDWLIQLPDAAGIAGLPFIDRLGKQGTLVLWEKLDRLCEQTDKKKLHEHLYERMEHAENHLSLVFHRFLSGERPFRKIRISINNRDLKPFDPFNSGHRATIALREEVIQVEGQSVCIQPFILPHHKKISARDWEKYGGEAGYLKNQGFYVYRAGRLIIHGTWFRLARQSELTKLARVRVDMPNGLDHLWKIDVKKASAQPPLIVREALKRIIDEIAGASNRVYTVRGRKIIDPSIKTMWGRRIDKGEVTYEIDRDHPSVTALMQELEPHHKSTLNALLYAIEGSFPVDALFSDMAGNPVALSTPSMPESELSQLIGLTLKIYMGQGLDEETILENFGKTEPYKANWEQSEKIIRTIMRNH